MTQDVARTVLLQIAKKISVEDGDILVVNSINDEVRDSFVQALSSIHPEKRFILVEEDQIDMLREMDEKTMRELGWERIKDES